MSLKILLTAAAVCAMATAATAQTSSAPAGAAPTGGAAASPAAASPAAAPAAAAPAATARVAPHGDLVETMRASGQFNTFLKATDATNLTAVLKGNQNLTVFAPTDAAFAALPAGQLDKLMADPASLQKVITHHIINARVDSSKIKGAKGPVPSVAGNPITLDGSDDALKADNATIVQADVAASNGVLHVVDHVLDPSAVPAATAAAEPPAQASAAASSGKAASAQTSTGSKR
jgi:uncharacterized surface protein with fasciclin (FAS1) repeats